MKKSIKIIYLILIVVLLIGFGVSLMWFLNGSLEMFPTAEQEEKAKIAAFLAMIVFAGTSIACIVLFSKEKISTLLKISIL